MKSELIPQLKQERKKFERENDDLRKGIEGLTDKIHDNEQKAEEAKERLLEKNSEFQAEKTQKEETLRCNNELIDRIDGLLKTYDLIKEYDG